MVRRIKAVAGVPVGIVEEKGSVDGQTQVRNSPKYLDTGESGETYDLEFEDNRPGAPDKQAIEKAREFLREQGKLSQTR
jgi:hypothetical protein